MVVNKFELLPQHIPLRVKIYFVTFADKYVQPVCENFFEFIFEFNTFVL